MGRVCTKCKLEKELSEFSKSKANNLDGIDWQCKLCRKAYKNKDFIRDAANARRRFRQQNDIAFKERRRADNLRFQHENHERYLWRKAKQRAVKCNLEFNIEVSDIKIPEYCPILEIRMFKGKAGDYQNSPSVDRIDSSKGYIKGNIAIISTKANTMKSSASLELLEKFSKNILKYYNSNLVI